MKNENVALRRWRESDADALFALASDPIVGQMARFPVHADKAERLRVIREIFCFTSVDNAASRRVMEKACFRHVETKDGIVRYAFDV